MRGLWKLFLPLKDTGAVLGQIVLKLGVSNLYLKTSEGVYITSVQYIHLYLGHFNVSNAVSSNSNIVIVPYIVFWFLAGILYTITDVQELGEWMKTTLDAHPLFEPLTSEELVN